MPAGGGEIAFTAQSHEEVDARCAAWRAKGVAIALEPTAMDFGYTFVALDPDGQRLRVFAPAGGRLTAASRSAIVTGCDRDPPSASVAANGARGAFHNPSNSAVDR